jgi:hypothetical protein
MYRARNVLAQPSSAYPVLVEYQWQKLTAAISTDEWDIGELRLVREGGGISLSLCQGRRLHLATVHLCLLQCRYKPDAFQDLCSKVLCI